MTVSRDLRRTAVTLTTGVAGRRWRASVTPWGAVEPWDSAAALDWYVAADDRWHVPAAEPAVRQRRIEATPVIETRVRIPGGDAVQRVYSVADGPGFTVVEVVNDSSMPIAVAFSRRDVRTERPVADVPIEGIDLPADAFVVPVGHRSVVRVAMAHDGSGAGALPAGLPSAAQVASGWRAIADRVSSFALPPGELGQAAADTAVAARCELLLTSPVPAEEDPAAFLVGLGELARMGEPLDPWLPELVDAVASVGPEQGWFADVALEAAARILAGAGERRAIRDLERILDRRGPTAAPPEDQPAGVAGVPWLEGRLARAGELLPAGLPTAWWGSNIEVHRVPVGRTSTVSYAIRWHAERPAVLWEVGGDPVELTAPVMAPGWRGEALRGEALWPAPVATRAHATADGDVSFS